MPWYDSLDVGKPYFYVGFVDRNLTIESINTLIYLGKGVLGQGEFKDHHCFQEAHTVAELRDKDDEGHEGDEDVEQVIPSFIVLTDDSLSSIADKQGLVRWLQATHSTNVPPDEV